MAEIYAHYVRTSCATFELEAPGEEEFAGRLAQAQQQGFPWWVAELPDGRIAGYAYAGRYRPRPGYRFTVEDSVYIHPDCTGHGIGGALLERIMELCRQAGAHQMVAVIGDSQNMASIWLHERFGFTRVGVLREVGFKHERWVDSVLMQKGLGG
jgi:phosphinothricin acetyltransferase